MPRWIPVVLIAVLAPAGAAAGTTIEDFTFIEGRWCAKALGGDVVERWEAPIADTMTGTMTATLNGAVQFHEFFFIAEDADGWSLKLKHFNADMVSWEEREEVVRFSLDSVEPGVARFGGLVMTQPEADALDVVVQTSGSGSIEFNYKRCTDT